MAAIVSARRPVRLAPYNWTFAFFAALRPFFSAVMAVFTEVSEAQAGELMHSLNLGALTALRGIEGGIENTK